MAKKNEGIILIINELTVNFKNGDTDIFEVEGHEAGWHTALNIVKNGWNTYPADKILSVRVKTIPRFVRKEKKQK